MRKKQTFLPPRPNHLFISLIKAFTPILFRFMLSGLKVQIPEESLQKLKQYSGKSLLILPNHPTAEDPYVLIELSKRLGINFYSVAAREVFDLDGGLRGLFFQWLGAYSLIRGAADRESFKTTKDILIKGTNPLVIFIEGEISNENDTLIPFEPGVVQLAFKAQEDKEEPVHLLPLSIKYIYDSGIEEIINNSIAALEKEVGLQSTKFTGTLERLNLVGGKLLEFQEKRLNLTGNGSVDERMNALRDKLLSKMEFFLDLKPDSKCSQLDRIRNIRNKMDKLIYSYTEPENLSNYEERMVEHLRGTFKEFYDELDRLVNFLVLNEGYLSEKQTPERFVEVIRHFEKEVYGESKISFPRTAHLKAGEIISLKDSYSDYLNDKKTFTQKIAARLEADMRAMLAREI